MGLLLQGGVRVTVYLVMVRVPVGQRYTDSIWVECSPATERVSDLKAEFERRGWAVNADNWWAWVSRATVTGAKLEGTSREA